MSADPVLLSRLQFAFIVSFHTQLFLLIGVALLIPMTLAYTAFSYYVFRGKVREGESYH